MKRVETKIISQDLVQAALEWSERELERGKLIKVKERLFRVVVHSRRTEWIVSNDPSRDLAREGQRACALRWKIE